MGSLLNGSNDAFCRSIIEIRRVPFYERNRAFGTCRKLLDVLRAG